MRKKYLAAAMLGTGVLVLAGCGNGADSGASVSDTESVETAAMDYNVSDYVKLGDYKGLSVQYPVPIVDEEEVQMEIEYLLEDNTTYEITDRGAEKGDLVNINYTGTVDGEEFDGGSDENFEYTLGKDDYFPAEFDENLIGKKAGEQVTFKLTLTEDYDDDLVGKEAEFSVTLNTVSESFVPEYNDAFIKEVTDYDTVDAYEDALREELMLWAQEDASSSSREDALQMAVQNAEINGYPQALYDVCYNSTLKDYQESADMLGMELSDFIEDDEALADEVISLVNDILVAQAIAEQEGFAVTDDNYKEEGEELAVDYGYESLEEFESDYGAAYVKITLVREKAVNFLYENANIEEVSQDEYFNNGEALEDLEISDTEMEGTEILLEPDME